MMIEFIRYWIHSRALISSPNTSCMRPKSVLSRPFCIAARLFTVALSWLWSPASTARLPHSSGIQHHTSRHCAASSTSTTSKNSAT